MGVQHHVFGREGTGLRRYGMKGPWTYISHVPTLSSFRTCDCTVKTSNRKTSPQHTAGTHFGCESSRVLQTLLQCICLVMMYMRMTGLLMSLHSVRNKFITVTLHDKNYRRAQTHETLV